MKRNALGVLPAGARIVFMGTPEFAVPGIEMLLKEDYAVVAVVTQPDRPRGRGRKLGESPVKMAALDAGIEVLQPSKVSDKAFLARLGALRPDLLVVIAFGQVLNKDILDLPPFGAINIHGSLLPRYRGAAPIQWAILKGESETGLTAMLMDEGLDSGPELMRLPILIGPEETFGELHDRMALLSGPFLSKTLQRYKAGRLNLNPQDESRVTYAPKIDRDLARIRWEGTAPEVSAQIRAMDPFPGAFSTLGEKTIKMFSSLVVSPDSRDEVPGRVAGCEGGALLVATGGGVVGLRALQLPGRRRLPVADFLKGFPITKGTILGLQA